MTSEQQQSQESGGLTPWFRQRRQSWARRNRRLLQFSWLLLALYLLLQLARILHDSGSPGHLIGLVSLLRLMTVAHIMFLLLYFLLTFSCISYCLPGSDMLGRLGNTEFHRQLRRHCLAICNRFGVQFLLLPLLVLITADAVFYNWLGIYDPFDFLSSLCMCFIFTKVTTVLAAQLCLRLPGMALALRMGLGLFALLLIFMLSGVPLFVIFMLTDNFSTLHGSQEKLLVNFVPPLMLLLIYWGLLRWSLILPGDLLEELDRHTSARRV